MDALFKAQKYSAAVESKEKVSSKVYLVRFKLIEPSTLDFQAGQNIVLLISEGINRTMSIASPPGEKNHILIAHDVTPMGSGSQWTLKLKVGDEVELMGPTGGTLALAQSQRKKVFVATGVGISPFHSILLDLFSFHHVSCITHHVTLYWGLRFEEDIFWQEEFQELEKKYPNFKFNLILSKPSPIWPGLTGHVTEHVLKSEKNPENCDFYLCGSKEMVGEVKEQLLSKNVPKEQVKTELIY